MNKLKSNQIKSKRICIYQTHFLCSFANMLWLSIATESRLLKLTFWAFLCITCRCFARWSVETCHGMWMARCEMINLMWVRKSEWSACWRVDTSNLILENGVIKLMQTLCEYIFIVINVFRIAIKVTVSLTVNDQNAQQVLIHANGMQTLQITVFKLRNSKFTSNGNFHWFGDTFYAIGLQKLRDKSF